MLLHFVGVVVHATSIPLVMACVLWPLPKEFFQPRPCCSIGAPSGSTPTYFPASAAPFTLRIDVDDAFAPTFGGARTFRFGPLGAPRLDDDAEPDATLRIGIAALSSVIVGSLHLRDALRHRLATVEPRELGAAVDALLAVERPPQSQTRF